MKSAHEWYLKINSFSNPSQMNDVEREWVEKMINEARKEAIEECAEKIELFATGKLPQEKPTRYTSIYEMYKHCILSLIKELK